MTPFSLIVSPGITLSLSRSGSSPWKCQTGAPARKTKTLGCPLEGTQKALPKGVRPQSLRLPAPASCPPSVRHLGNIWRVQRCSLSTYCVLGSLLPSIPTRQVISPAPDSVRCPMYLLIHLHLPCPTLSPKLLQGGRLSHVMQVVGPQPAVDTRGRATKQRSTGRGLVSSLLEKVKIVCFELFFCISHVFRNASRRRLLLVPATALQDRSHHPWVAKKIA